MARRAQLVAVAALVAALVYVMLRDQLAADSETGEGDQAPDLIDYTMQAADAGAAIFESTDDMNAENNMAAFLVAIRQGEGASGQDGYTVLCGGGHFSGFAQHPAMAGWSGWQMPLTMAIAAGFPNGAVSTAAGAYQINRPTWKRLAYKLGLPDFSPISQDRAALELISEKGAFTDARAGRIEAAVSKIAKIWASLPGAGYGQREVAFASFADAFTNAGGVMA